MTIRVPEPNAAFAEVIILLPVSLPTKEPLGKSHLVCKCCLGYQISTCSTSEHSRGGLSQPGRYNKGQGSLQTTDIHSPQFWRLAGLAPGESLLPGLQVAACCVLTWRGEDALASLLIRTLISSWGFTFMVSSKPAHSPRAHLLISLRGLGLQHMGLGGTYSIHHRRCQSTFASTRFREWSWGLCDSVE